MEATPFGAARLAMCEASMRDGADSFDIGGAIVVADATVAERDQAWLRAAAAAAPALNLAPPDVYVAAELASLAGAIEVPEWRALTLVFTQLRSALQRGSTRIPVYGPEGRDSLCSFARNWCRAIAEQREGAGVADDAAGDVGADAIADAVVPLLDSGRAAAVVGEPGAPRPLVIVKPYVHLERLHRHEAMLVDALASKLADPIEVRGLDEAVAAAAEASSVSLTDEQLNAVRLAVRSRFGTISGGPGTGKTSIVVAILRAFASIGLTADEVAVAAPTGKAAKRLEEAIGSSSSLAGGGGNDPIDAVASGVKPRTLHRLLGYLPNADRFRHGADNVLPYRAVIVDEASMIDVTMMARLLSAVAHDARLICLGDADQLPSVDAGAVFKDVNAALPERGIRLRKSFRMRAEDPEGRHVLSIARAVNAGDADAALGGADDLFAEPASEDAARCIRQRSSDAAVTFRGVEARFGELDDRAIDAFLAMWFERQVLPFPDYLATVQATWRVKDSALQDAGRIGDLLAHYGRAKVLAVTRHFATGVERVNAVLHGFLARATDAPPGFAMAAGDPIVVDRNDYQRGLFNGDQGILLRTVSAGPGRGGRRRDRTTRPRLSAVFPRGDGLRAFPFTALRQNLSLAFAQTVHKSQGSEFDHVALMLPPRDVPLLTREILYTAITRARKSVTITGPANLFVTALERQLTRHSGLAEALER